jgi:hypothetical protein
MMMQARRTSISSRAKVVTRELMRLLLKPPERAAVLTAALTRSSIAATCIQSSQELNRVEVKILENLLSRL